MAAPTQSREQISFTYDPREAPPGMIDFVRRLEGFLQRLELRVETLQDQTRALEARVVALENP